MKAPSQRDLLGILEFLHGASSVSGPHTFGAYVTSELPRLIPATLTAYAELDLAKRSVRWTTDRPDADFPNAARVLAAHIPDNPFIVYRKRTGDQGAVRLSDVTTEREFRDTGLYREFYRPLRVKHSMACALRSVSRSCSRSRCIVADQTSRREVASVSSCFGRIWPTCSEASS